MDAIQNTLRAVATVTGLIVILAALVSLLFKSRRERGPSIGSGSSLRRGPVVVLITVGLLVAGFILWQPFHLPLPIITRYWLTWIGFVIYTPAIGLYLWGLLTLGEYFGVSTAIGADLYAGHQLIKNGPYRFVRHPMYLAVVLAALGAFLVFQTWAMLIFLPMSTIVFFRASQEERLLESAFGEEWRSYARQVPGWIPRLYWKNDGA